jgi:hypothetical protein
VLNALSSKCELASIQDLGRMGLDDHQNRIARSTW